MCRRCVGGVQEASGRESRRRASAGCSCATRVRSFWQPSSSGHWPRETQPVATSTKHTPSVFEGRSSHTNSTYFACAPCGGAVPCVSTEQISRRTALSTLWPASLRFLFRSSSCAGVSICSTTPTLCPSATSFSAYFGRAASGKPQWGASFPMKARSSSRWPGGGRGRGLPASRGGEGGGGCLFSSRGRVGDASWVVCVSVRLSAPSSASSSKSS